MTDTIQPPKRKRQKKGDAHYVNNKAFTLALDNYSRDCRAAEDEGKAKPQMSNYLGECILKMSTRLANSPRFSGYSYRDEMIQNGILAAIKYSHNFNGDKYDNGFAYITQIIFSHFVITIKNEKKKYETNLRLIQEMEALHMDNPEFAGQDDHARSIADQKLADLSEQKMDKSKNAGGFMLRTGYTKESRDNYAGGTPVDRGDEK